MTIRIWQILLPAFASIAYVPKVVARRLLPGLQLSTRIAARNGRGHSLFGRVQMACETEGKVALITGGTSRFGEAIAKGLAESNKYDKVIIVGRDERTAARIIKELQERSVQADFIKADLSHLKEVRAVCRRLQGIKLQCLVCAAGATALRTRQETPDGYEYHFGLNFLSRFLMVNSLMDELSSAGTANDPARVLLVSSDRHWGPPVLGFASLGKSLPLAVGRLDDMQFRGKDAYRDWEAFGQAALCNVMFSYELQKRFRASASQNVAVSCFDPGPMETAWHRYRNEENRELVQGMSELQKGFMKYFTRLIETPEIAAKAPVRLATRPLGTLPCSVPAIGGNFGCYFFREFPVPSKYPVPWSWGTSYDEAVWARLWQHAEALIEESSLAVGHAERKPAWQEKDTAENDVTVPRIRPVYAWLWFWWHAPRPLALALAGTFLQKRA